MEEKWQEKGSILGEHEKKVLYGRRGHSYLCIIIKKLFSIFQVKMFFPTLRSFDPSFRNSPLHRVLRSLAVSLRLSTVFPISWLVCLPCHSVSFPNLSFLTCESYAVKWLYMLRLEWGGTGLLFYKESPECSGSSPLAPPLPEPEALLYLAMPGWLAPTSSGSWVWVKKWRNAWVDLGRSHGLRWVLRAAPYRARGRLGEECNWVVMAEQWLVFMGLLLLMNIPCLLSIYSVWKVTRETQIWRKDLCKNWPEI